MKILGKTKAIIRDKDFKEILFAKLLSITIGVFAGLILSIITDRIELIPGLLILLPGFLEMHGNILGSLSARLGTKLHTKEIKAKFTNNKFITNNIISAAALMFLVSLVLGILAYLALLAIFNITNFDILFISIIAALISMVITIPLTITMTFWFFKHKYEPDDVMGPYVSSLGDIISIAALFIAVLIII